MTRAVCRWLCVWTLVVHGAAVLAPVLAGPLPAPVLQHTCPNPTIISRVACPSPAAVARGTPWKCTHDETVDTCRL